MSIGKEVAEAAEAAEAAAASAAASGAPTACATPSGKHEGMISAGGRFVPFALEGCAINISRRSGGKSLRAMRAARKLSGIVHAQKMRVEECE
jgi:hypothetical protein